MNVLLLTADSLRADRTSLFGHSRDTTPFIADFANDSFEFRLAYANGFNTSSSFPALLASTHQSYFEGIGIPESGTPTLAEVLGDAGYATRGIHTNELVSRDYNYDRGFNVYHDSRTGGGDDDSRRWRQVARRLIGNGAAFDVVKHLHFLSTEYLGVKIFDTADAISGFRDTIVDWATRADDDWFVWAHYMNPHHPYEPPEECQEALGMEPVATRRATKLSRKMRLHPEDVTDDERETLRDLYDASVLSWDREIEATFDALDAAGELDDTLVIVTADHGELLGEDGYYGHPKVLKQQLLRIPLVFGGDPVEPGISESQVALLDVAPTIATFADGTVPGGWHGRPLFDADGTPRDLDAEPQFSEVGDAEEPLTAVIDDDRKVVHDVAPDTWSTYELPDTERLTERETDRDMSDLEGILRDHESRAAENRERGARVDEEQLRDDLAALGYLDE